MTAVIKKVREDSPAYRSGLRAGDILTDINNEKVNDVIDFHRLVSEERIIITVKRGVLARQFKIERLEVGDLGIEFETPVFDKITTCDNKCSFCFIYQLPRGLRKTLYKKDDDYRLSFLYGNFTTLTRFSYDDLLRVVEQRLDPLFVSIHATNPDLRAKMLGNERGSFSLAWLSELLSAGLTVHGQIVLIPGVNDGHYLDETLEDIILRYPELASVAIVPIGISKFYSGTELSTFAKDSAEQALDKITFWRGIASKTIGHPMFYPSDELFLIARANIPEKEYYQVPEQLENGVGLLRDFAESFLRKDQAALSYKSGFFHNIEGASNYGYRPKKTRSKRSLNTSLRTVILTSEYACEFITKLIRSVNIDIDVVGVKNEFFGGNIKVAGLITGNDLSREMHLYGKKYNFLFPDVALSNETFIDGVRLDSMPDNLIPVPSSGGYLRHMLDLVNS